nr:hypothetical protein [Maliibacterium massiliense]
MRVVWQGVRRQLARSPIMALALILQVLLCSLVFTRLAGTLQFNLAQYRLTAKSFGAEGAYVAWRADESSFSHGGADGTFAFGAYNRKVEETCAAAAQAAGAADVILPAKMLPRLDYALADGSTLYDTRTLLYPAALADALALPLSAGARWDSARAYSVTDEIPVIVSPVLATQLPLGSTAALRAPHAQLMNAHYPQDLALRVRVVGVLDAHNTYWDCAGLDYSLLGALSYEGNVLLMPDLALASDAQLGFYQMTGAVLRFMDDENARAFVQAQQDPAHAQTLDALRRADLTGILQASKNDAILAAILFVIALTGIGANNALARFTNEKAYGVYFMGGATWRQCVWMDALRSLLLIAPPGAGAVVCQALRYGGRPDARFVCDAGTVLMVFAMLALIYLLSALGFILETRKRQPIDILRRWT